MRCVISQGRSVPSRSVLSRAGKFSFTLSCWSYIRWHWLAQEAQARVGHHSDPKVGLARPPGAVGEGEKSPRFSGRLLPQVRRGSCVCLGSSQLRLFLPAFLGWPPLRCLSLSLFSFCVPLRSS